jgi:catechol 2,3-dioxygenase-like lactoylglutathione lyase family enzyme
MDLASIRIITDDIKRLVAFYEQVLERKPKWYTDDFVEIAMPSCTLAIGSTRTMQLFGKGAAHAADNHSVIIELRVADVDRDYARLEDMVPEFVQTPTTQPWGNRSLLFRDPDGNLLNFFTPVTPAAIDEPLK